MADPPSIVIDFYYDCLSPFSYFAFVALRRYMEVWKSARIELKPFVLAGVNAKTGNVAPFARPWAQSTMKEQLQHLRRNVEFFNVPGMLPMPANFFGPDGPADRRGLARDLRYQRLLVAVRRLHPERLWEVTGLVFDHIWASREARDKAGNVAMSEAVLEDLCLRAGLPAEAARRCVEAITAEETKRALAESVEEAVHRGGYGAPTIVVAGVAGREEMVFFGSDRFEQLAFCSGLPWYGPDPSRPTRLEAKL